MANIASSKKDARTSAVRATRNRAIKSAVKTKVTKFRRAVAEGAPEAGDLGGLAGLAISSLDRAVAKGVLHRNNAARRKARLVKRLQAAGAEPAAPAKAATAKAAGKAAPRKSAPAKASGKRATKTTAGKSAAAKPAARRTSTKKS